MTISVDTNLLVYAIDRHAGSRHDRAVEIVGRFVACPCGWLVLQVLAEFYSVATRKLGSSPERARSFVGDLCGALPVCAADVHALDRAMSEGDRHGLSFWDALLWATADGVGVRYLLSEDFQDGRRLGGVKFVDPFEDANRELLERVLPPAGGSG